MGRVLFWFGRIAILRHRPWFWYEPEDSDPALYSDYIDEMPFWVVRAGENRMQRVTKMLQMGFISPHEARAMLGG